MSGARVRCPDCGSPVEPLAPPPTFGGRAASSRFDDVRTAAATPVTAPRRAAHHRVGRAQVATTTMSLVCLALVAALVAVAFETWAEQPRRAPANVDDTPSTTAAPAPVPEAAQQPATTQPPPTTVEESTTTTTAAPAPVVAPSPTVPVTSSAPLAAQSGPPPAPAPRRGPPTTTLPPTTTTAPTVTTAPPPSTTTLPPAP